MKNTLAVDTFMKMSPSYRLTYDRYYEPKFKSKKIDYTIYRNPKNPRIKLLKIIGRHWRTGKKYVIYCYTDPKCKTKVHSKDSKTCKCKERIIRKIKKRYDFLNCEKK